MYVNKHETKQKASHTPGPWHLEIDHALNNTRFRIRNGSVAVLAGSFPTGENWHEANARLIAAAPKLLEALRDLLGDSPAVQGGDCQWCGREYGDPNDPEITTTVPDGDCPSDDCPSFLARAAIAEATSDLLGDLMHWCDRNGFKFDLALERARGHYEAETGGEGV